MKGEKGLPQFSLQKEAAEGGRRHSGVGVRCLSARNLRLQAAGGGVDLLGPQESALRRAVGAQAGGERVSWEDGRAASWVGLSLQLLDSMGHGLCFL